MQQGVAGGQQLLLLEADPAFGCPTSRLSGYQPAIAALAAVVLVMTTGNIDAGGSDPGQP